MANRDAAAAELAELSALRDQAARRQQELGATVHALAGRLRGEGLRAWAWQAGRRTVRRAARHEAAAAWRAARTALSGGRRRGRPRAAVPVIVALPACVLAAALTWRRVRGRATRRLRPGPLR